MTGARWGLASGGRRFVAGIAVLWAAAGLGHAQDSPLTGAQRVYQVGQYTGPVSCATSRCHAKVEPATEYNVQQDEFTVWNRQNSKGEFTDPHRGAQIALTLPESAIIVKNLGLKKPAYEAEQCLTCHATLVPQQQQAVKLDPTDGVSCEACHGPAGGWIQDHTKQGWNHEQSVKAGMIDLRSLSIRAQTCLGCHLANAEHEVGHPLIAAGHPDLVFELDNFSETMPPHWDEFKVVEEKGGRAVTHGARAWAVGQVEALRYALQLLIRRTKSETWPEFAEMSCDACHHALDERRFAQDGYRYRDGFPPWSPARWLLLREVVAQFAPDKLPALEREMDAVSRGISLLKSPEDIRAAAQRAIAQLEQISPVVAKAPLTPDVLRKLMLTIVDKREVFRNADRVTAYQAALALNSMTTQLNLAGTAGFTDEFFDKVAALLEGPIGKENYDRDAIEQAFAEVGKALRGSSR